MPGAAASLPGPGSGPCAPQDARESTSGALSYGGPKASPQNTIALGVGLQRVGFGGHKHPSVAEGGRVVRCSDWGELASAGGGGVPGLGAVGTPGAQPQPSCPWPPRGPHGVPGARRWHLPREADRRWKSVLAVSSDRASAACHGLCPEQGAGVPSLPGLPRAERGAALSPRAGVMSGGPRGQGCVPRPRAAAGRVIKLSPRLFERLVSSPVYETYGFLITSRDGACVDVLSAPPQGPCARITRGHAGAGPAGVCC